MTGLLYEKLIVQPAPTRHGYYEMVKDVLQEAYLDLPEEHGDPRDYETWVSKWFGNWVMHEPYRKFMEAINK